MTNKKILYVDMDGVLVDFKSVYPKLTAEQRAKYNPNDPEGKKDHKAPYDLIPNIFSIMEPINGAIAAYEKLSQVYETYILSTAPWENPSAWSDKLEWVKKHLGNVAHKRLILSHNKHLNKGDYLIDDRKKNGADKFDGELIHFASDRYPDWDSVLRYLLQV
jgi:5'-nucleotidase